MNTACTLIGAIAIASSSIAYATDPYWVQKNTYINEPESPYEWTNLLSPCVNFYQSIGPGIPSHEYDADHFLRDASGYYGELYQYDGIPGVGDDPNFALDFNNDSTANGTYRGTLLDTGNTVSYEHDGDYGNIRSITFIFRVVDNPNGSGAGSGVIPQLAEETNATHNNPTASDDCPPVTDDVGADSNPTQKGSPVNLRRGAVIVDDTDLKLEGIGAPIRHSRRYSSRLEKVSGGKELAAISGAKWQPGRMGMFARQAESGDDISLFPAADSRRNFGAAQVGGSFSKYEGPADYRAAMRRVGPIGAESDRLELAVHDRGEIYEFERLGSGDRRYVLKKTYARGNAADYVEYGYDSAAADGAGRITVVTGANGWTLQYHYHGSGMNGGKIQKIEARNGSVSTGTVIAKVEYTYQGASAYHADTGSEGDLIQAKVSRADSTGALTIIRTTQYRYDSNHRLTMKLEPAAVQTIIEADGGITDPEDILELSDDYVVTGTTALKQFASYRFEYYGAAADTSDIDTAFASGEDLNTRYGGINADETGLIKTMVVGGVGGGCCGGAGGAGITKSYYHLDIDHGQSPTSADVVRLVVEDSRDGESSTIKRIVYALNDDGHLLRKVLIEDPISVSPNYWCESWIRGTSGQALNRALQHRGVSAHRSVDTAAELRQFLDPSTGTNDSATLDDSSGVVVVYTLNAEGRITETKIKQGETGMEYFLSATDYGDGLESTDTGDNGLDNDPLHLPIATYAFRTQETLKTNGLKTTISYTFWDAGDTKLKTRTTTLPKVPTSQNGSGDGGGDPAITSSQYFDESGRMRWSKDGNRNVSYYAYHPDTGGLAYMMQDVETDDLPAAITAGSAGKWIEWDDGASGDTIPSGFESTANDNLQLVSTTEFDDQGRPRKMTDSGGTVTYTVYDDNRTLVFPAWDDPNDEPLLPIQVTVVDDGGQLTEQCTVDPARTALDGSNEPNGLSGGTSQAHYLSWTRYAYNVSGQIEHVDRYHNIPGAGDGTLSTNFHRTIYQYDAQGRRQYTVQIVSGTDPSGGVEQVTKMTYDVLDRVIKVEQGVSSAAASMGASYDTYPTLRTISETFYDEATPGSGTSGVGDGLVTSRRGYYGTGGSDYITVENRYNSRNQMRGTAPPAAPFTVQDLDWMGRVIAVAQYDTEPNWATVMADDDYAESIATDRLALSTIEYDDLGRIYRRAVHAIDQASGSDDGQLVTNNYYDFNSNLVATETAGAGGTELAYDGADRQYQTRVVTALEATKYAAGAYQYRAPVPDPALASMTGGDDEVIQIAHAVFDASGNVIESINLEANHDDTTNVGLDVSNDDDYVQTAVYSWYDEADRVKETANYGTSDTDWTFAALTARPGTAPASSDTILVTAFTYDTAGRLFTVTDPAAKVTRTFYDDLGRTVYTVENYANFNESTEANTGGGTNSDEDRVTKYVYNGLSQLTNQIALDADADGSLVDSPGGNQDTVYLYEDTVSAARVTNIIYPDSTDTDSTGSDQVKLTYNVDGSIATRTDQIGNVLTHYYDGLRRLKAQVVTSLAGDTDGTVRSITRDYDDLSRLAKITSHGDQTSDPDDTTDVENQVVFEYTDFGQLKTEYQEHDGVKDGSTHSVAYAYDETKTGTIFDHAMRLNTLTYPNGRKVHYTYGTSGDVGDDLSRIAAVNYDNAGSAGDPIAAYSYNGVGRVTRKDLDEPDVRLDYFGGTSGEYAGFDRFGRVIAHRWDDFSAGAGNEVAIWDARHAYDRASNRLHSDRQKYTSHAEVYTYDNLHRLQEYNAGQFDDSTDTINDRWLWDHRKYTLDALGNHLSVDMRHGDEIVKNTPNDANEYVTRKVKSNLPVGRMVHDYYYDVSNGVTAADYVNVGPVEDGTSTDAFTLTLGGAAQVRVTAVDQDTFDGHQEGEARTILLRTEPFGSAFDFWTRVRFPAGATTGRAGVVFGYRDANDYWISVYDLGAQKHALYHVVDGTATLIHSINKTLNADTRYSLRVAPGNMSVWPPTYSFADATPAGKVGLYTDTANVDFESWVRISRQQQYTDVADRWLTTATHHGGSDQGAFLGAQDALNPYVQQGLVQLAGIVTDENTQVTFSMHKPDPGSLWLSPGTSVGFGGDDDYISFGAGSLPDPGSSQDKVWFRMYEESNYYRTKGIQQATAPSEGQWSATAYGDQRGPQTTSHGPVWFNTTYVATAVDNLVVKSDRDNNGSYETTDHKDDFTVDEDGYADIQPTYDAAGNLTYDGRYRYTYDAWNRLVEVEKAYRDPDNAGAVTVAYTVAAYKFDGLHRRTVRAITNQVNYDAAFHDYYDGQSVIETRNGSDLVLKQHVWGVTYIDELVQIAVNNDPVLDPEFDPTDPDHDASYYYTVHNANYNVALLVDATGAIVERYEYDPYGQRTVYTSYGSNDPDAHAPTLLPQRAQIAAVDQPYALCDFGFQGKQHCDVTGVIFQGIRVFHPRLGRSITRDWLHYPDGMNAYAGYFAMWGGLDPTGMAVLFRSHQDTRTYRPITGSEQYTMWDSYLRWKAQQALIDQMREAECNPSIADVLANGLRSLAQNASDFVLNTAGGFSEVQNPLQSVAPLGDPRTNGGAVGREFGRLVGAGLGLVETFGGSALIAGGGTITIATGGGGAVIGVPAAAVGGGLVAQGATSINRYFNLNEVTVRPSAGVDPCPCPPQESASQLANRLGREGENGIAKNTQRIPSLSGRRLYRVPDELGSSHILEVKNVKYQHFSSQLQDTLHYALMTNRQMILRVRSDTVLSSELRRAVEGGWIKLELIK